jgi:hypothetical protein
MPEATQHTAIVEMPSPVYLIRQKANSASKRPGDLLVMPTKKKKSTIELIINMRKNAASAVLTFERATAMVIERYLEGRLDTAGHHVEVCEVAVGGQLKKILLIDGKG